MGEFYKIMPIAAASNALTTVANVKYVWGRPQADTGDDDRIQTLINLISDRIEYWCGRKFTKQTYTDELHDGNGDNYLFLKQYPIVSVTEIKRDDIAVDSDYYKVYEDEGFVLKETYWTKGYQNLKVTYEAGFETIPPAIAEIAIEWIIMLLEGRMKDAKVDGSEMGNPPDSIMLGLAPFKRRDF